MFFFFFNEPKQVKGYSAETLTDFLNLIGPQGLLCLENSNFFDADKALFSNYKNDFRVYIAKQENDKKIKYLSQTKKDRNLDSPVADSGGFHLFYRGISNSSFEPIPSVYRGNNFVYEDRFIKDIRVSNYDFLLGKDYLDELSALQHYGCPTRLLDLTSNPLVALYFACEDALNNNGSSSVDGQVLLFLANDADILHSNSDKVLVLTAVSHLDQSTKKRLYNLCVSEIQAKGKKAARLSGSLAGRAPASKLYQEIQRVTNFEKNISCMDLLQSFYVQPPHNNLRIRAQHGLFLLNGLCGNPAECAKRNENKIFAKITVPAGAKARILSKLDEIGINKKTLFPEIEEAIKYLKAKYE